MLRLLLLFTIVPAVELYLLLQLGSNAFEFRAFALHGLLTLFLLFDGLDDERRQRYVPDQHGRNQDALWLQVFSETVSQRELQRFLGLFLEEVFGTLDALALLAQQ